MKKIFILLLSSGLFTTVNAQETTPEDALRLSIENLTGTARFRAMSGAFGAVGGDLSAINQNPAGSVFFNHNFGSVTGSVFNTKNRSTYFGTKTKDNDTTIDLNQAGAVFVFNDNSGQTDWKKIAIAFNYDNTNNYGNSTFAAGTNPNNSIGNYFLNIAQGIPLNVLTNYDFTQLNFYEQQAYLGYDTYLFEADNNTSNNTSYYTNIPLGGNYYQENAVATSGYNGKLITNFATTYKDFISFGMNLNFHFVDITKTSSVYESNTNPLYNTGSTITELLFENQLSTLGSGFSFSLGTIFKANQFLRFGLSYESPTWYRLTDELTQGIATHSLNNQDGNEFPTSYQPTIQFAPYKIQTPSKWTGSAAFLFNKKGLISIDVTSKDYSATRFKPKNDFRNLNTFMSSALDNTIEVRLGGEYKIKQFSVRGGYHFDQSPYKTDVTLGDLTGYSGGIGYNFGESKLDLAYNYEHRKMNQLFVTSGMTDSARVSQYKNNITLTYSINF